MDTRRVRIAVAMSENGARCEIVDERGDDRAAEEAAFEFLFECGEEGRYQVINFIEADLPLPQSFSVEGRVTETRPVETESE